MEAFPCVTPDDIQRGRSLGFPRSGSEEMLVGVLEGFAYWIIGVLSPSGTPVFSGCTYYFLSPAELRCQMPVRLVAL